MKDLSVVKNGLTRFVSRTGLKVKKHSPEILIATGVVSIIGGTVLACKATLKAEDILDEHESMMDSIDKAIALNDKLDDDTPKYTEEDAKKDHMIVYTQTTWEFVKLYAPSATLVVGGIVCILASYGIMKKRHVALTAAYQALSTSFADYRKRVVSELGEDEDKHFMYGTERKKILEVDPETGKITEKDDQIVIQENLQPSQFAKFFDERSMFYKKNAEMNLMFLHQMQAHANDLLQSRGHVFLNEVYDMLDIDRTQAGALVGWKLGEGDDFIDFGIYNVHRQASRDFVNGYERAILLDFNVCGPIYNLI